MAGPFPCPNSPSPCETSPNPLTNFSSEAQDSTTFIGLAWNGNPPPLNKPFNLVPCEAIAESQVSQADADRIAQNAAVTCEGDCVRPAQNSAQTASGKCSDGSLYFLTVPAGLYLAENQVLADRKAFAAAVQGLNGHSVCIGSLAPPSTCANAFYFGIISVISTDPLASLAITDGSVPNGLSVALDSDRIVIEGTPTTTGIFNFTLMVTNSFGVYTLRSIELIVVKILTASSLPDAFFGTPYITAISLSNPANVPVVWSIVSGSLPGGLALDSSSGIISGTPNGGGGVHTFTVQAVVGSATCSKVFTINAQYIDWSQLVWTNILVVPGGGAGGTATGVFSGATFSVSGKGNGAPSAKVEATGTLTYTGPLVNCKVTVTVTAQGTSTAGFRVQQDGVTVLLVQSADLTVGTHTFTFTIIAGTNSVINVRGLTDLGDPARLFVFVTDSVLWAFGGTFANA